MIDTPLPTLTYAEASTQGLHPAVAFRAFAIPAGTIRAWASSGAIQARAIGPRGARLYSVADVAAHSIDTAHNPRTRRVSSDS